MIKIRFDKGENGELSVLAIYRQLPNDKIEMLGTLAGEAAEYVYIIITGGE